jgi:hypothetical protein
MSMKIEEIEAAADSIVNRHPSVSKVMDTALPDKDPADVLIFKAGLIMGYGAAVEDCGGGDKFKKACGQND